MPGNNRDSLHFHGLHRGNGIHESSLSLALSKISSTSPRSTPSNSKHGSPISYPSSPISTSPTSMSPLTTLRRNYSSTFMLIPEDREIDIIKPKKQNSVGEEPCLRLVLIRILLWWPLLISRITLFVMSLILRILFIPFSFATPSFWLSALLWVFWKATRFSFSLIKWALRSLLQTNSESEQRKRTVLISCGSTIQTLHLARNFYSSGARVVVFEFEGLFGLSRFSSAVSKFYTVPRPTFDSSQDYIAALCDIVEKENPTYYIPVCATSSSYYDALAKPHLEILGCATFIPSLQENIILDDILEVMKISRANHMPIAPFKLLTSKEELYRLYDSGWMGSYRNIIVAVGSQGVLERHKIVLPQNRRHLKLNYEISEEKIWIVLRNVPGEHYITCTTVKDSKVIANVTCLVNQHAKNLIPEQNKQVEKWLHNFFDQFRPQRPVNGHISFRFVKSDSTGELLPIGSRVGVSLPYICYTGLHSRVLCKPCPHFLRQNSGPLVQEGGRYWIHEAVLNTLKHPSMHAVSNLIGTVLDKREALFTYWDPLPYCAYYHFQLPLRTIRIFLEKRLATRNIVTTSIITPVH